MHQMITRYSDRHHCCDNDEIVHDDIRVWRTFSGFRLVESLATYASSSPKGSSRTTTLSDGRAAQCVLSILADQRTALVSPAPFHSIGVEASGERQSSGDIPHLDQKSVRLAYESEHLVDQSTGRAIQRYGPFHFESQHRIRCWSASLTRTYGAGVDRGCDSECYIGLN